MADPQDLAAHRQRRQILSVVQDNRVTMIVGDTGCGKSTQVPKILLDQVGGRVLCTQPRRLAVVAVASRVAEELGEELGGSVVGYHIGQDARAHEHTKLVFSTIGIALEQIKSLGLAALTRYSCIIVDEVHERSAESDVVLACIRQLAPHAPHLKLVLMSATAEPRIYQDFFAGVDYAIVALAKDMTVHHILEKSLEHALDRIVPLPVCPFFRQPQSSWVVVPFWFRRMAYQSILRVKYIAAAKVAKRPTLPMRRA